MNNHADSDVHITFTDLVSLKSKELNKYMKAGNKMFANDVVSFLFGQELPKYSNNRIAKDEWVLNTGLKFVEYQICLLANCGNSYRCLAILEKSNNCSTSARDVLDEFCYSVMKISTKRNKGNKLILQIQKTNPGKLVTTRRSFYVINKAIYNEKLSAVKEGNVLVLRKEQQARIADIFFKYVYGMEEEPNNRLIRLPQDLGIEQFMINDYPTEEWRSNVLGKRDIYSGSKKSTDSLVDFELDIRKHDPIVKNNINFKTDSGNNSSEDDLTIEDVEYTKLSDYDLQVNEKFDSFEAFESEFNDESLYL